MSTIYVIIKVRFDYYRFQENVGATTSPIIAKQIADQAWDEWFLGGKGGKRRGKRIIVTDRKASDAMREKETAHILIETWENKR